jgi:hypothetical protein
MKYQVSERFGLVGTYLLSSNTDPPTFDVFILSDMITD